MMTSRKTILGSLAWAAAMLAGAYVFKGRPAGDWIDSVLLFGFIFWLSTQTSCAARATGKS